MKQKPLREEEVYRQETFHHQVQPGGLSWATALDEPAQLSGLRFTIRKMGIVIHTDCLARLNEMTNGKVSIRHESSHEVFVNGLSSYFLHEELPAQKDQS